MKEVPMPDNTHDGSILLERAAEQLRQEHDSFEQLKKHSSRWSALQLTLGYSSVFIFFAIAFFAGWVLLHNEQFTIAVVTTSSSALFVDAIGLVISVWKIVLKPNFYTPLTPTTKVDLNSIVDPSNKLL
jgi:hypothetical protein